jgi:hypothetical protein
MKNKRLIPILVSVLLLAANGINIQAQKFEANGPTSPLELKPEQFLGAVKITFDLLPTSMSFDLPWHYCIVTENGLKFANFAPETYDPRNWEGTGANASFEVGMDEHAKYVRVWIEHASDARIVVRLRYALCNSQSEIAHSDIPSGSPYGNGDWGDEWCYIYPDGTYLRHMKVYTGLASMSLPFGFNREPPQIVHEFMESIIIGPPGHNPTDDINTTNTLNLYKMIGDHTGEVIPEGIGTSISYNPCPDDYGSFKDANIMVINTKSEYKPFTIALPYGIRTQPYTPSDDSKDPFETWRGYPEPSIGYIAAIGHMLNYWHFRRTENTLEQLYLHGITNEKDPQAGLVDLAWSWIVAPRLEMTGFKPDYLKFTYDQAQKTYIVPRTSTGPEKMDFSVAPYENMNAPMRIVNPAFVIKNWNDTINGIVVKVDNAILEAGKDFRYGFEQTDSGNDLVIWMPMKSETAKHIAIEPVNK